MTSKIYWLVAGQVVTANKQGIEHLKGLNVIVITDGPMFTRMDLAKSQEGMQRRFVTECPQIQGFKIKDIFIQNIMPLGQMTVEEFNAGFEQEVQAAGGMN